MHGNYINVAVNAMDQNNFKVANEYYRKANQYGSLTIKEWIRRFIAPVYNIIKNI